MVVTVICVMMRVVFGSGSSVVVCLLRNQLRVSSVCNHLHLPTMPFVGSVSFHHALATRHDILIIGNPLGPGSIQFVCFAPLSALVFAVIGGVPTPPLFAVTLLAMHGAPPFPPVLVPNILPAAVGIGLFQIRELCGYVITLLPGQGHFEYTSPRMGQVIATNTIRIRSQVRSSIEVCGKFLKH
jgi:hypothetical protein